MGINSPESGGKERSTFSFTIAPLEQSDLISFTDLMREGFSEVPMTSILKEQALADLTPDFFQGKIRRMDWVVLAAKDVAGSLVGGMAAEVTDGVATIWLTCVKPSARKKGIATHFIHTLEEIIATRDVPVNDIIMFIDIKNKPSLGMSEKTGFTRINPHQLYPAGGMYHKRIS